MNKKTTYTMLFAALLGALVLAGCSTPLLDPPRDAAPAAIPEGFGTLRVSLNQGAARTVMSEGDLSKLELKYLFAKDGGEAKEKIPADDKFTLEPGSYELTVKAFADNELAAEGSTEEEFAIAAGIDAGTVSVALRPLASEGTGSLEFGLQYPSGVTVEALTLTRIAGAESFNLLESATPAGDGPVVLSGTKTNIPAGYYLLRVALKDSAGLYAGKSEVAHIYGNLSAQTRLEDYTFAAEDFSPYRVTIDYAAYLYDRDFRLALQDMLQKASPELNAPGNPVPVKVVGLDLSTKLGILTDTLTRYASLDLSDCAASLAETQIGARTADGPWGHIDVKESNKVIDLVLPAAVTNLNLHLRAGGTVSTFTEYSNLRTIVAPGVVRINDSVFRHCAYLERVELPALQVMHNTSAFRDCPSLKTVIIPSVEIIGKWAFAGDTALETIEAANVASVGPLAFEGANTAFDFVTSGALTWNPATRQLIRADGSDVTLLAWLKEDRAPNNLPAGITKIGDSLFFGMTNITSIDLPATITAIGEAAFDSCSSLAQALLPGVKELGTRAFGNTALVQANFPEVTFVGERAFQYCFNLESVNLPKVVTIGNGAFNNGTYYGFTGERPDLVGKLSSVSLGNSLTTIGEHAFIYAMRLESLSLPGTVDYIGSQAFGSACAVKTLTINAATPPVIELTRTASDGTMYEWRDLFEGGAIETIYVPPGSVAAYKAAPGWDVYADLITAIVE
jgi:hypothetical protein